MATLAQLNIKPFLVDITRPVDNIGVFLDSDILIINITSKDIPSFEQLAQKIKDSKVQKVIFVSSTSVYKNVDRLITEKDGELESTSALLSIENLFINSTTFKTTIIRFGGLIGYSRNPGRFFRSGRIVAGQNAPVNLIHRDDCINILAEVVKQNVWGEVFNACADTHPTKREFYTQATQRLDLAPPNFDLKDISGAQTINSSKLEHMLNYEFVHPDLMAINFNTTE